MCGRRYAKYNSEEIDATHCSLDAREREREREDHDGQSPAVDVALWESACHCCIMDTIVLVVGQPASERAPGRLYCVCIGLMIVH